MIWLNYWEMLASSPAKRDKTILISHIISCILNIILWLVLLLNFWNAKDLIVLRNDIYFGISALGLWFWILMMPLLGLLVILINSFWSFQLYLKQKILSYFLAISTLIINIILITGGFLLISANI